MNELETQLVDLGAALEVPKTPELMSAVHARIAAPRRRRRGMRVLRSRSRRVSLALAAGLVALLAGVAAAVPPVRHAVEQVLGLRGARVERVRQLPPLPAAGGRPLNLGRRIAVVDARHAASFTALLPPSGVEAAYVARDVTGGRITLAVGKSLVIEFRGQSSPYILKLIGTGTRVRRVRIDGGTGIYLDRSPHEVFFADAHGYGQTDTVRLAGAVLLWQRGPLILRIEGAGSFANALALARSLR